MKKYLLSALLLPFFVITAFGETILEGREAGAKIEGAILIRYKDNVSNPTYIRFAEGKGPLADQASEWLTENYKLDENFSFVFDKKDEDDLGYTHIKFRQYYLGIKVEFSGITVHAIGGRVVSISGMSITGTPNSSHSLDELSGLENALEFVGASVYKWQLDSEEKNLKRERGNDGATYFPTGEKVFLPENANFTSSNIIPCWKYDVYAHHPVYRAWLYVSAVDGSVVFENKRIKDIDTTCTAVTAYSGNRTIVADYFSNGNFRLREGSRGDGVETYDMLNGTNHGSAVDITNGSNLWPDTLRIKYATDAHWGAEMVYDYYSIVHGRNSIDDNGMKLLSYVHYDVNYANAFWDGDRMTYGDGNGSVTAMTTLDITGHEITHGVDQYTSDLIYQNESGALDESFADIFGNCVEARYKPDVVKNWLVGEEIGNHFRSMSNPNTRSDPDTYFGTNWYTGTADNGGVHTNSGVQNHWFYLLTIGGSGTNDNSDVFSVTGLGWSKAEKITYRSRAFYLSSSSDYEDARFFAAQAAIDLYGPCSPELASTVNAWYAVGVGDPYSPTVVSDFEASVTTLCGLPATVSFKNLSNYNAVNFVWDFGDNGSSSLKDPVHTYTTAGTYTVELIAIGNATCGSNIKTKTNYIVVSPPADIQVAPYSICDGYQAKITANATNTAFWYADTISDNPIFIGSPYISPVLFKDTVFYAANGIVSPSQNVGPANNNIGGGANFTGYRYLVFDVYQKITLQKVTVYSYSNTSRVIELRDVNGSVLQSKTVTVPTGEQVISLDFIIEPGTDYQLGVNFATTADFFRNSDGAAFPYTINGLVSIKNSGNAPISYYYFFYNWVVKGGDCVGKRFHVDVTVDYDPDCVAYLGQFESGKQQGLDVYPNPSQGLFYIKMELADHEELNFTLIDSKGSVVFEDLNVILDAGQHLYKIEKPGLPKGVYLLRVKGNNLSEIRQLIIQ